MENQLKKDIKDHKVTMGAWLTIGHHQVAEALCSTGFYQWLAIDVEHSSPSYDQATAIFAVCDKYNVAPLVRVLGRDPYQARKYLDMGAHGIIIPVVEDTSDFDEYLSHLFYPPKGKRGVCLYRMNEWGDKFEDYISNFSPIIIPQIETLKGAKNAEEIMKHPEVDACFVGPYDLSGSLKQPGQFDTDEFKEACKKIEDACKEANKPLGLHVVDPDPDLLALKVKENYKFIAFGTDMICMRKPILTAKTIQGL